MFLLADVTFLDAAAALVLIGLAERIVLWLPEGTVGPGGWLLDTGTAE